MYVLLSHIRVHAPKHAYILISLIISNFTFHFTQKRAKNSLKTFVAGEAAQHTSPSHSLSTILSLSTALYLLLLPLAQRPAVAWPDKIDEHINCFDCRARNARMRIRNFLLLTVNYMRIPSRGVFQNL